MSKEEKRKMIDKNLDQIDNEIEQENVPEVGEEIEADEEVVESGAQEQEEPQGGLDPDIEQKARDLGWVSPDEFHGDTKNHMDAETFIKKRGDELSQLRKELRETKQTMEEFKNYSAKKEERAYERALAEIKAKQRIAVEEGDTELYESLDKQRTSLEEDKPKPAEEVKQPGQLSPDQQQTIDGWVQNNPWFNSDPELNAAAQIYHTNLANSRQDLSLEDNLAETTKYVKRMFPEKFGNPRQSLPTPINGKRQATVKTKPTRKGADDLPPTAKEVGQRFIRQGLFKDLAEYAEDYFYN